MPRLVAATFDRVLLFMLGTTPEGWGLIDVSGPSPLDTWNRAWLVWGVTVVVLSALLEIPAEAKARKTVGKAITNVRVVLPDDSPLGWGRATIRWAVQWGLPAALLVLGLPAWTVALLWGASAVLSATDGHGRTLHDFAAGSLVTRSETTPMLRGTPLVTGMGLFGRAS